MNAFKILVVDDEVQILRALKTNLEARDYKVWTARDGEEAIRLIGDVNPDLLILDLGLPKKSGLDVLRSLRSWSDIPVIIVSARDGDPDKIAALDEGADDYLTKPFSASSWQGCVPRFAVVCRSSCRRSSQPRTSRSTSLEVRRRGMERSLTSHHWSGRL
jgi:two-component system KDP operon response regulator KdpE